MCLCGIGLFFSGQAAPANKEYPDKPVRIIVGFAPGGANDVIGRLVAQKLNEAWKQSVIVDNRPGASGMIGAALVARAPADGYTLLLSSQTSMAVAPSLYAKAPYDTLKDFAPITIPAWGPGLLVINKDLPVRTVPELIALAKSKPGQLSFGSGGVASTPHMTAELFNSMFGLKIVHVPYKGEALGLYDLIGNQIQVMFPSLPAALPHARSGRLRALGVTSLERFAGAPEFPPLAEVGAPGFEANGWYGLFAPAGTPKPVMRKIYSDLVKVLGEPDGKAKLLAQGRELGGQSPDAFAKSLKLEIDKWAQVIKTRGIHVE
jgi:tripartite-type tricarboxylate transporter receptor subunit TctC